MTKPLFTPIEVEQSVTSMDSFRNDILGAASFFAGISALQFQADLVAPIATASWVFITAWGFSKTPANAATHSRFFSQFSRLRGLRLAYTRNFIFFVGFTFLGSMAVGLLKLETLHGMSFALLAEWLAKKI